MIVDKKFYIFENSFFDPTKKRLNDPPPPGGCVSSDVNYERSLKKIPMLRTEGADVDGEIVGSFVGTLKGIWLLKNEKQEC